MAAITITPANLVPSAQAIRFNGVAAETITQGQALYLLAAGTYGKCDNDLSLIAATFVGIAESAGSAGQTISILRIDSGKARSRSPPFLRPFFRGSFVGES